MAQALVTSPPWRTRMMTRLGWPQLVGQPLCLIADRLPYFEKRKQGFPCVTYNSRLILVAALQDPQRRRRAVDFIRRIPQVARNYFRSPFRRALFGGISLLGGFYVAQTISLSFGALGVNDVIAAALCVLITEYITRYYHTRAKTTFPLALLNNFKMGFTYGLFIDAFKLAS